MTEPVRVLVVDDDFMVARLHSAFVGRVPGFEVVGEERTGQAALAAVQRLRPDLVLLDIYLPDMTGLDVLKQLRATGEQVDVVVVSAARDVETVQAALHGGVVQYLVKPFTGDDLGQRLLEFARRRARMRVAADAQALGQGEVDALFQGARAAPVGVVMPKGLTPETLALVSASLQRTPVSLSAQECAEEVGLARVTARRYLEFLVEADRATVAFRYGRAGRPERRYSWAGDDVLPSSGTRRTSTESEV